jgi:peptide/nickel transport system permease protein
MNPKSIVRSAWNNVRTIASTKIGFVGLAITLGFVCMALFAPWIAPYSPTASSGQPFGTPSLQHPLGTDDIGEDLLSQLIWGARGSLLIGVSAGILATIIGVGVGLFAGYFAGKSGEALMRLTDVVLVLPLLPLLIVIAALFPSSVILVIVVIGLLSWPQMARVIRSQTLTLKERPFIDASRLSGMSDLEIMIRVLVPNMLPLVVLYGVFAAVTAVVVESGLDFIGLGSINNLSWGIMLYFALSRDALLRGAWWWFLPPGLMIALLGVGFIFLGHGVERIAKAKN